MTARSRRRGPPRIRLLDVAYGGVVAAIIVAAWRAPQWRWRGTYEISGNQTVSRAAIERLLPHPIGRPLFLIDPRSIRRSLGAAFPSISRVEVRRWLFPNRISITVVERKPAARVMSTELATGSPLLYLDESGHAYPSIHPLTVPLVADVVRLPLSPGDRRIFLRLLAAWPDGMSGLIDMRDPAHLVARVAASIDAATRSFEVFLGAPKDLDSKFLALDRILPLAEATGKTLEYVDVRFPDAPAFKVAGDPLSPRAPYAPGEQHGQHGQGMADSGHRHRTDGGHLAVDTVQEPGGIRPGGTPQPASPGPLDHAKGQRAQRS